MVFTDNDSGSEDADDGYDLDGPSIPHKATRTAQSASSSPAPPPSKSIFRDRSGSPSAPKRRRVSISSDSDSFAEEGAYSKWANKKKTARSKAVKSARKAKATEAANNPKPPSHDAGRTGVGRRAPKKKQYVREKKYGDQTADEDDLMEWTMPDYLQERRKRFDERRDRLKVGGLSLPPVYDDVYFSDDENLRHLKEKPVLPLRDDAAPYEDIEMPYSLGIIPASIAQHLRPYQVDGAKFLHELFVYQKGGILGDDMGLGKTIQVIAFLTAAFGKTADERDEKRMRKMREERQPYYRILIICPGSLMANWMDELNRWGWWHANIYHGTPTQKADILRQVGSGRLEIMITTYDTYRIGESTINMIKWDCVIADECHKIKERKADTTKKLNQINALCRIGLTGTAIQNKYEELWTLLNWTNPGKLGPITTWKASVCEPLKMGQSHNASQYELARARKTARMLVNNLLPQFFLRRTKELIKHQLPKKTDRVVFCPLTETQADAYQNFLESDIVACIRDSSELCSCGGKLKQGWCCKTHVVEGEGLSWQQWVFPAIQILQKISNHLAILIPQGTDTLDKQSKDLDVLQIAMPNQWRKLDKERDSMLHTANSEFCGKWKVLKRLLKFWSDQGDNKVLVFSHSVRLLRMLQHLFISTSYNVKYLDGSMSYDERFETVQEFNTDPTQFVFLISTKAGGVGLNITSANKVVVVDPNWNPAYDLQAQDRAYRIGQTRDVEVFRLVSQGTLEEIVYARQIYKQQQASIGYNASSERRYFQGVQGIKDQKGEIFGLKNLFAWHNEHVVLRDIVNKTNVAESKAGVHIANIELEAEEQSLDPKDDDSDDATGRSIKTEPDTEDAAISQLAAEITGEAPKRQRGRAVNFKKAESAKHDPVQAILSSVGVSYTHENSEVIGTSTVEDKLSKAAEAAAADEMNWNASQQRAMVFQAETQTQTTPRKARIVNEDGDIKYHHQPPQDVKLRQFGAMARYAGFEDDVVGFALLIEAYTQKERREFLDMWYEYRRGMLAGAYDEAATVKTEVGGLLGTIKVEEKVKIETDDEDDDEL